MANQNKSSSPPDLPLKISRAIPWWIYLSLGLIFYLSLEYLLPQIAEDRADMVKIVDLLQRIAPIISIAFLLLAANTLYQNDQKNEEDSSKDRGKGE